MKGMIQKYAELAIRKGVNLQKGQILIINASINAVELTRACVEEAYKAGAKRVQVFYQDEYINRSNYFYQSDEELQHIYPWEIDSRLDLMKDGACILHIISEIPGIMNGVDASKISKARMAKALLSKELQEYTMLNKTQWCIIAVSNKEWADVVFPEFEGEIGAEEELMDRILSSVHVREDNDPIEEWTKLNASFQSRIQKLNTYHFDSLHFVNSLGTDLYVELPKTHIWAGGSEKTESGVEFNPNMPTEEIFSMPKRDGVNGIVYASRPLLYNGTMINDFWIRFKDGKAVEFDAKEGLDALTELINFDEGSSYLGEVALVPYHSPISESGILFYNTLFDENASCHLALGDAYPMNIENGTKMSEEELKQAGANSSLTHVDFMFGNEDMCITGSKDGKEIPVFKDGDFVF